jgi:predicted ATPase
VIVGENGSGKSTLVEGLAVAAGFAPEGGSIGLRPATRDEQPPLADALRLVRGARRPRTGFFLRAESFFNVMTAIDDSLAEFPDDDVLKAYGGRSLHERSHGEGFLALAVHRFGPNGLYVLDEPESALSPQGQLAFLRRMHDLVAEGSQFVLATHAPMLMGYPGAYIYELGESGPERVDFDDVEHVRMTRSFLDDPGRFMHHLLGEP